MASMLAFEQDRPLRDLLAKDERVTRHLSLDQIDAMLRPEAYVGLSGLFVDRVAGKGSQLDLVAEVAAWKAASDEDWEKFEDHLSENG